jgi:hypothetical protein
LGRTENETGDNSVSSILFNSSLSNWPSDSPSHFALLCLCIWRWVFPSPYRSYRSSSKSAENFWERIRENIDLKLEIRQVPDVDAEFFNQYIKETFIPTVAANRELPECVNKPEEEL